ncbi:Crp/Fnr family transcriptional regulator [Chryseobacterium sp. MEBOG07]|uniref:Crp/Fnr family transcriptional regulator n=1 Tax=Chryseobacterium sp. MEBOG07 TaxID=2879939 RepID=UPI001F409F25|nr:cyclic nucleotide-binding domain-containing protein [Chryseobacterium sp. MEBOG07]UKB79731.1 cyclic nucleotide-binding domain-containing protein [Chryseobacterium sp. MEBOG07]
MFENIKNRFPFPKEKWRKFLGSFERMEVPAKTLLLKEDEVSYNAYYIEKGMVRAWYNNDGKDVTFQFFLENTMFSSLESFRKGLPSMVSFETIEPCILYKIKKPDVEAFLEEVYENPELRTLFMDALFERVFDYMKHFFHLLKIHHSSGISIWSKPSRRSSEEFPSIISLLISVLQRYISAG